MLLAIVLSINASSDPDLGFHLATGRAVIDSGAIPSVNVLSYAEPDHPWIDQQWLPATIFFALHEEWHFAGTLALRVLLVAATTLVLVLTGRALGARPGWTAVMVTLGTWAAALRFVERPLLFSNLALAVVLFACAAARRQRAFVVLAGVATSVAIHLHSGAIFSVLALVVIGIASMLEPIAARWTGREPIATDGHTWLATAAGAVVVAAFLLSLYHPHAIEVLTFPLRMATDPYLQEHLVEFRSPIDQPLRLLAPYWLYLALAVVIVLASVRRAPLPWLAILAMVFAISLRHARFVDLAWIGGAPVLAALASLTWERFEAWRLAAITLLFGSAALIDRTEIAPMAVGPAPPVWPMPLFDVVRDEHLVGPAFVQDGWAGPFLARFWPRERVFFHPAFEAYSVEHYRLYQSVRYGEPGWDTTLDRFGVQLVLMRYTSPHERELQHGAPNLRQHLAASPAWALVSFDDLGEIFVRRGGPNDRFARDAPSGVDPDRLAFDVPPRSVRRALDLLPGHSDRLAAMRAVACADDGDADEAAHRLSAIADPALAAMTRDAIARLARR